MVDITDLKTLDETTKSSLAQLLLSDPATQFWGIGDYAGLTLNFSIIKHLSSLKEVHGIACHRIRYEVMDNVVFGAGNYGSFFRCRFTLSFDEHRKLIIKERKPDRIRLVKVQSLVQRNEFCYDRIYAEAIALGKSPIFHSKPLVLDKEKAYIVMKELPGVTLQSVILNNNLTIKERYTLTIELVKALKEQIHDKGWIHRDITPHNILVYQNGETFQVFIIDFGFISEISDMPTDCRGSPFYAAEECHYSWVVKNEKTDIYALGLILGYLWNEIPVKAVCHDELMNIFEHMMHPSMVHRPDIPNILKALDVWKNYLVPTEEHQACHYYYAEPDHHGESYACSSQPI
ncbi:protein kinase family protein [Legionella worsleiensis]|uniref:Ser/Thr protein kinase n=1 Tax=Legionella worsleiensis TaxID=45076 RepID=A0A0W1ALH9_9GAMM|nr:protein kinase family protein [Legionella worsleiensis]KTD82019.1 Ser/Thr protein kinase [Legionella worsleiensis]STY30326.1 Ser/Thr protein kinase [Legionella worsleiensis]